MSKYYVSLKTLLQEGLSEFEFYGELFYKFRKKMSKLIFRYNLKRLSLALLQKDRFQHGYCGKLLAWFVNPIMVKSFTLLIKCTTVDRSADSMTTPSSICFRSLRKHAYSNTLKILPQKNDKSSDKKFWYFSYFCSKHRLWVFVRTASSRRF